MLKKRVRQLKKAPFGEGCVVYWMDRERRVFDNHSLFFAQELAQFLKKPLVIVYVLASDFLQAGDRQNSFLIESLKEVEKEALGLNLGFFADCGEPASEVIKFCKTNSPAALVTDFNPLKLPQSWRQEIKAHVEIPFFEVDSRNIIPAWIVSDKKEFAAYTLRPKVHRLLAEFLTEFPKLERVVTKPPSRFTRETDWQNLAQKILKNSTFKANQFFSPGSKAANLVLFDFLKNRLSGYHLKRNDPCKEALSNLSPYLHYGNISAQRVAFEAQKLRNEFPDEIETFLEELIVRRELAENFCFYEPNYDNFNGFPNWAQKTLNEHRADLREFDYDLMEFEFAKTHDDLWNAAQLEMVKTGKMHGYLRMYWCKKILEWSSSPEKAQEIAIYLNDKYELDGRDPNGYAGIAWSIGGVHDRAWFDRPIFGKVRYMNLNGCKKKFAVDAYIGSTEKSDLLVLPSKVLKIDAL
jgi:deoxyribodipyrimidine photo-lyase